MEAKRFLQILFTVRRQSAKTLERLREHQKQHARKVS
jgi:hypothetical protein